MYKWNEWKIMFTIQFPIDTDQNIKIIRQLEIWN